MTHADLRSSFIYLGMYCVHLVLCPSQIRINVHLTGFVCFFFLFDISGVWNGLLLMQFFFKDTKSRFLYANRPWRKAMVAGRYCLSAFLSLKHTDITCR